jgi:hypothetical protein
MQNKLLLVNLFFSLFLISCKNSILIKAPQVNLKQVCASNYNYSLKKQVYTRTEIEPEFPGGMSQYTRYMFRNVKCTEEMVDAGDWQTHVEFKFIVDTDGQIKYPSFRDRTDTTFFKPLEKEITRVLQSMPKWTPAMCNGKAVAAEVKRSMVVCLQME